MKQAKHIFHSIYYSFPLQLFLLHLKKNQLLLFYWLILTAVVTSGFGGRFGIPYLFLDPEYLGEVDFRSMYIMGFAAGGFIMSYNISSYILNGFRFPFLASLSRPFQKYFFNNFLFPLSFLGFYLYRYINFQLYSEFAGQMEVFTEVLSFLLGASLAVLLTLTYFFSTDKDIFRYMPMHSSRSHGSMRKTSPFGKHKGVIKEWRVDSYLVHLFKVRLTRGTEHYDREMLMLVARRNHLNAALVELIVFVTILVLGLFRETPYLRIPAGASILLLFTMVMLLTSAYRFWLRGWSVTVAIAGLLILNIISQNDYFSTRNQAYGLSYNSPLPEYNIDELKKLNTRENYADDVQNTIAILERWKKKNETPDSSGKPLKPKMVFICTSGGGLRSAMWSFRVLQAADSASGWKLFNSTQLITGASGGSIGAAYYRELYLRKLIEKRPALGAGQTQRRYRKGAFDAPLSSDTYIENLAKDLLNPVALSIVVNDLFLSFQHFTDGKNTYPKDRAYEFEKGLNFNTGFIMNKTLGDYAWPESQALIPMMVFKPTIINDGRRLFISTQPVSYFTNKSPNENLDFQPVMEGVEYSRFFKDKLPLETRFMSVLRMNATFPYIMPTVALPSSPPMEIMDAGMRDNYGLQTTLRFLYTFRKWIASNTSGVVIMQVRDTHKDSPPDKPNISLFRSITSPLENFYVNFAKVQDYNLDELMQYAGSWYEGKIDFLVFQLPEEKQKVSLSWHLTTREKQYIYNSIELEENQKELQRVREIFGSE